MIPSTSTCRDSVASGLKRKVRLPPPFSQRLESSCRRVGTCETRSCERSISSGQTLTRSERSSEVYVARFTPMTRYPTNGRARCRTRSEEHTSELQSRENLVCRRLLVKKKQ